MTNEEQEKLDGVASVLTDALATILILTGAISFGALGYHFDNAVCYVLGGYLLRAALIIKSK